MRDLPSSPVPDAAGLPQGGADTGWCVMRQDDNGNTFVLSSGLDEVAARAMALEFERRGHKQMYWIRRQ